MSKVSSNIKALILDRDGTLIKHVHYLSDPDKVELLPGVKEGLNRLKQAGYRFFLHTNQSGVGRGMYTIESVNNCNQKMAELLGAGPDFFERVCIATETPKDEIVYRKPSPKFVSELIDQFGFKPHELCYIGDRLSDLSISDETRVQAIGVNTGMNNLYQELKESGNSGRYIIFDDFTGAVKYLVDK